MIDKERTGRRIQELFLQRGLTVKDVAERLSVGSVQCVYQWLNGRRLPTIDNLSALAELLEVEIDDILCKM